MAAMSKLVLELQVPDKYDKPTLARVIQAICYQVNLLSEGSITARYQAQASVPSSSAVAYVQGDMVWDSNPTVRASVAPGVASNYVRLGWLSVAPGKPGTFVEVRTLTGT